MGTALTQTTTFHEVYFEALVAVIAIWWSLGNHEDFNGLETIQRGRVFLCGNHSRRLFGLSDSFNLTWTISGLSIVRAITRPSLHLRLIIKIDWRANAIKASSQYSRLEWGMCRCPIPCQTMINQTLSAIVDGRSA